MWQIVDVKNVHHIAHAMLEPRPPPTQVARGSATPWQDGKAGMAWPTSTTATRIHLSLSNFNLNEMPSLCKFHLHKCRRRPEEYSERPGSAAIPLMRATVDAAVSAILAISHMNEQLGHQPSQCRMGIPSDAEQRRA